MSTRRLRPIGWVAGVAGAALGFYLVSLQVAAESANVVPSYQTMWTAPFVWTA